MAVDTAALERLGWHPVRAGAIPGPPEPGAIQLWLLPIPEEHAPLDELFARLSPAEQARSRAKRIAEKRREYVTGQAALRTLLGHALGIHSRAVLYARGRKGKPYLAPPLSESGLQFNITHSGGVVVVALSSGPEVGVDVEWHNLRTDAKRVARRVFTRAERARMDALPVSAQRDHFFRMWTCKEALVKCTGLGIHSGMAEFQVSLDPDGSARVTGAWERQAGVGRLLVHRLPLGAGHAGALVHEPPPSALSLHLLIGKPDPLAAL